MSKCHNSMAVSTKNLLKCETDVRLWQVEFQVEDRDRLGPRLYRRGLHE